MCEREVRSRRRAAAALAVLGLLGAAGTVAAQSDSLSAQIRVKQPLTATRADDKARGEVRFGLRGSRGKFEVKARRLDRDASYDVIVGGVKVGALQSGSSGSGRIRFRSQPSGGARLLGFDPRGSQVSVRSDDGRDVLVARISDDTIDPTETACCHSSDDGAGDCEDRTPDACTAAGGTPLQTATCIPDPCGSRPPTGGEVVCCVNESHDDGAEAECESESEAKCAAAGGTVVQAASCHPNPCASTPPVNVIACCVTDSLEVETECEDITAEACTARGGAPATAVSCDPDPCGGGNDASGDHDGDHDGGHDD